MNHIISAHPKGYVSPAAIPLTYGMPSCAPPFFTHMLYRSCTLWCLPAKFPSPPPACTYADDALENHSVTLGSSSSELALQAGEAVIEERGELYLERIVAAARDDWLRHFEEDDTLPQRLLISRVIRDGIQPILRATVDAEDPGLLPAQREVSVASYNI